MERTQRDGPPRPRDVLSEACLRDGGPDDADALAGMLRLLSPASAFMRFLVGFGEPKPGLVRALLATGPQRGTVLAVLPGGTVVGHACWSVGTTGAPGVVDVGVVVLDGWQRRGLGRALVEAAVTRAAAAGGRALHLDVHPENRALLTALRRRLPTATRRFADGLVTFDVPLTDAAVDDPHEGADLPRHVGESRSRDRISPLVSR